MAQHVFALDVDKARRLYGLAAEQGNVDAQYDLALMHHLGVGGPPDLAEARRLYALAAEQGDVGAQYNLALMLQNGEGGPEDLAKAGRL